MEEVKKKERDQKKDGDVSASGEFHAVVVGLIEKMGPRIQKPDNLMKKVKKK